MHQIASERDQPWLVEANYEGIKYVYVNLDNKPKINKRMRRSKPQSGNVGISLPGTGEQSHLDLVVQDELSGSARNSRTDHDKVAEKRKTDVLTRIFQH